MCDAMMKNSTLMNVLRDSGKVETGKRTLSEWPFEHDLEMSRGLRVRTLQRIKAFMMLK